MREWLLSLPRGVRREIGADVAKSAVAMARRQTPGGRLWRCLYEVRTSHDREQYRLLFYVEGEALVLLHGESEKGTMFLVHGLHKKTQRTPPAAIALARKRMKEGT
jgi:phage-related protein